MTAAYNITLLYFCQIIYCFTIKCNVNDWSLLPILPPPSVDKIPSILYTIYYIAYSILYTTLHYILYYTLYYTLYYAILYYIPHYILHYTILYTI